MCGIAGVISWDEKYRVTRETLQRMSARIAHRGPDGEGFYLNHEQEITPARPQCGFAFRRLAILDPDPRAMQPFTIGDKTIVFNGEIYNFRELREELTKLRPEYEWRTSGDTEVLLLAYEVWGDACLRRLNGMFAIAVWDQGEETLYLARDRMGQKPLYLLTGGGDKSFAFASEVQALRELPWWGEGAFDVPALESYLRYGNTGLSSVHSTVAQLSPGGFHELVRNPGAESAPGWLRKLLPTDEERRFWHERPGAAIDDSTAIDSTRRLVSAAVSRQLVSDVPLGVFLSGGVDSSVVAACARRAGPVQTFSIGFDDPRYDESRYARQVAEHLRTDHHEFRVTPSAAADLPALAAAFGDPFADSSMLPTFYLARETVRQVKVALSGDGGDELFGGYDRYRAMRLAAHHARTGGLAARVGAAAFDRWRGGHPKSPFTRAARFLGSLGLDDAARYDSFLRVFDDRTLAALLGREPESTPHVRGEFDSQLRWLGDVTRAALATDRLIYLPHDLLTKVDRASMLRSLEVRSPFMDHELVQFAAGLTTDQLLKGGPKRMLREAFADDLPAWVFKRRKMGFAVPVGEWFRGELRPMLRDHLFAADSFGRQHFNMKVVERLVDEHERQRVDHSQRLYALLMLELWWKTCR
jgi:asparagine synthase (glutamine-hydrolysing)